MDWLTFTSNAIDSLAWPVAAVVLVVLLRDDIKKIVPNLRRLKAGPIEAEFERELQELRETVPAHADIGEHALPEQESKAFLFQLAELHPRSAILESWVRLEAAVRAVLSAKSPEAAKQYYIPAARLAEPLTRAEILKPEQVTLFHGLRRLRNDVAHEKGFEPTLESARAYIDLAAFLQGWLEGQLK